MDSFLHEKNLELLRRHLAESDPTKSPLRQEMLLRLLVERAGDSCPRSMRTTRWVPLKLRQIKFARHHPTSMF
jgi:hypothetical protein